MAHGLREAVPIILTLLLVAAAPPAPAEEVDLAQGAMTYTWETVGEDGSASTTTLDLPLTRTVVKAEASGFIARVTVQQFFANPAERRIEAIYQFPLPVNAAVHESAIRIGDRLVIAEIREREAAKKKYEKAKAAGKRTSLLEQERPNIFT